MKKIILHFNITLILLCALQGSFAQVYTPFPDSNAVWYKLEQTIISYPDTQLYQTKLYGLFNDTIINTISYHKMYFNDGINDSIIQVSSPNTSYLCAIRQDTSLRKVYFVPKDSINELVLYNFNINTNDTFYVYNEWGDSVLAWCISAPTGASFVGGRYLKTYGIKTNNLSFGGHVWIESVGNIRGLFETFYQYSSNKATQCLTISDTTYYKFDGNIIWDILIDTGFFKSCFNSGLIITGGILQLDFSKTTSIYPNPLYTKSLVKLPPYYTLEETIIEIFDINGRKRKLFKDIPKHEFILERSDFGVSGVYLIMIKNRQHVSIIKILVH